MNEFTEKMAKCSDDELLNIVIVQAFQYQENAVKAANEELAKRNITNLEETKKQLIALHFPDLTHYTDSELRDYALLLKFELKKNDKEVHHIFKMGNLPKDRCNSLIDEFDSSTKEIKGEVSNRNVIIGALWFFGGIFVTVFSMNSAQDGGSYVVAFGAIIYGLIRMLNLI